MKLSSYLDSALEFLEETLERFALKLKKKKPKKNAIPIYFIFPVVTLQYDQGHQIWYDNGMNQ